MEKEYEDEEFGIYEESSDDDLELVTCPNCGAEAFKVYRDPLNGVVIEYVCIECGTKTVN